MPVWEDLHLSEAPDPDFERTGYSFTKLCSRFLLLLFALSTLYAFVSSSYCGLGFTKYHSFWSFPGLFFYFRTNQQSSLLASYPPAQYYTANRNTEVPHLADTPHFTIRH